MRIKKIISFILISFLIVSLIYISDIENIPNSFIVFNNEELNIKTLFGMKIENSKIYSKSNTLQTVMKNIEDDNSVKKIKLKLFGVTVKEISVNTMEEPEVVVLGNVIGMKLYTKGVLVVGMSEIYGQDSVSYKPYENTGIQEGDTIIEINNNAICSTDELINCINESKGKTIKLTYVHNEEKKEVSITPVETDINSYKIGLWVRDTAAGVGTATFYDKTSNKIAALGHGILDADTEELIDVSTGELTTVDIVSVIKGESGNAGKIQGVIEKQTEIGKIIKNTSFGVFARTTNYSIIDYKKTMKIALRNEIKIGEATLLCSLDSNEIKEYKVQIEKIYVDNNVNNKSMLIKINDKELIDKTGGIIQGMSGSPIIQNNKLIGALTHVLVQEPTKGYAIFADLMVKQMREVE